MSGRGPRSVAGAGRRLVSAARGRWLCVLSPSCAGTDRGLGGQDAGAGGVWCRPQGGAGPPAAGCRVLPLPFRGAGGPAVAAQPAELSATLLPPDAGRWREPRLRGHSVWARGRTGQDGSPQPGLGVGLVGSPGVRTRRGPPGAIAGGRRLGAQPGAGRLRHSPATTPGRQELVAVKRGLGARSALPEHGREREVEPAPSPRRGLQKEFTRRVLSCAGTLPHARD